ncbi:MAG: pseudouridine synthase [Chitinophagales bacterium]
MKIRVNKYLSDTGICSRRGADKMIADGRVTVNGVVPQKGKMVDPQDDEIVVDGSLIKPVKKKKIVFLAVNKPKGITCTANEHINESILNLVGYAKRLSPIVKIDKQYEGLVLLSNDSDTALQIEQSASLEKEYLVKVDKPVNEEFILKMKSSEDFGQVRINKESKFVFRIIIENEKNKQIKRMCSALEYTVQHIIRLRIGNISIKDINVGKWRYITAPETEKLKSTVAAGAKKSTVQRKFFKRRG